MPKTTLHKFLDTLIHRINTTTDPYFQRITSKLAECVDCDPELSKLFDAPGVVMSNPLPRLDEIIAELSRWLDSVKEGFPCVLVHGDPHLGNIIIGRDGDQRAIRLIDPNSEVGFTDPVYDYGKLLHFAEPVGIYFT